MDLFHWAGLGLGAVIVITGLALAWKKDLTCASASKWDPTLAGIKFLNKIKNFRK